MEKCSYKNCGDEATTEGHVFTREKEFVLVKACDKHKKVSGFFENKKA